MLVNTHLNTKEYQLFKKKAEELGISEYELAKQGILSTIQQPINTIRIHIMLRDIEKFIIADVKETKKNMF